MNDEIQTSKYQSGQVVLLLLLIMVVALAIGLSTVQRSLVDVSTSTKVEESSRAFSAAEAGIERALRTETDVTSIDLGNSSQASVQLSQLLPGVGQALEYPPLAKEDIVHVWLADPNVDSASGQPNPSYTQPNLEIYWGTTATTDKPAIEISVIYFDGTKYQAWKPYGIAPKLFLDASSTRATNNKFKDANFEDSATVTSTCSNPSAILTSFGSSRSFYCKTTLKNLPTSPSYLVILRARLLYVSTSQPIAVKPTGAGSLPPQARTYISTGTSGSIQRKIQLFKLDKVVPFYFDFAIFSAGEISK